MINLVGGTLYQWDSDRIVSVKQQKGQNIHEVHLSIKSMENALVVEPYESVVE